MYTFKAPNSNNKKSQILVFQVLEKGLTLFPLWSFNTVISVPNSERIGHFSTCQRAHVSARQTVVDRQHQAWHRFKPPGLPDTFYQHYLPCAVSVLCCVYLSICTDQ